MIRTDGTKSHIDLTARNDLNGVSIAVGYLPESYINFGWFGPPVVMFFLGILLGLFDKIFLRPGSGLLLNSVGVALLPQLLPVEAQLAQYIAGVGQQVAVALITLAPMFDLHRNEAYRGARSFFAAGTNYKEAATCANWKSLTGRVFASTLISSRGVNLCPRLCRSHYEATAIILRIWCFQDFLALTFVPKRLQTGGIGQCWPKAQAD